MNVWMIVGGIVAVGLLVTYFKKKDEMPETRPSPLPQEPRSPSTPIYSSRFLSAAQRKMADLIVTAAIDADLNAPFMLALAVTESSLNPKAAGDDGVSIGLFQMNKNFISASDQELFDPEFNTDAAMNKMALLIRSYPGNSYGDYAEAWTLGGAGRFKKLRRNLNKWTTMQKAIDDLSLDLYLTEKP